MGKSTGKLFGDLVLHNIFYIVIIIEYLERKMNFGIIPPV